LTATIKYKFLGMCYVNATLGYNWVKSNENIVILLIKRTKLYNFLTFVNFNKQLMYVLNI